MLPDHYTHSTLDSLFFKAGAPEHNKYSFSNKNGKVQGWLRTINDESNNPLDVLGAAIEEFMETKPPDSYYYAGVGYDSNELAVAAYENDRDKIRRSLAKAKLQYSRGGHIIFGGITSTQSLQELVQHSGLKAVDIEIRRALENVEKDPFAAAQYAGNVLEAALKAYLNHHKVAYKEETDTLSDLWKLVVDHIGINPKELDNKDLKKIASGLNNIVDGTMHLRNKKSAAHGKSEAQMNENNIRPRHARLAIHAAHTIAAYVLELVS